MEKDVECSVEVPVGIVETDGHHAELLDGNGQIDLRMLPGLASPDGTGLDRATGFLLWKAANAWQRAIRVALEPLGLTHVQFMLLSTLARLDWGGARVSQAMLARRSGVDEMMTSQVLRTLESKSLIERQPHPTDQRSKSLALTEKGQELVGRSAEVVASADRDFFQRLGHDLAMFGSCLDRLLDPEEVRAEG
jgi:DNA-binding MarR family transcriptional regulator